LTTEPTTDGANGGEVGSFVQLLETYTNLCPIVDCCVVDVDKQGQSQLVTCSGAYKDGTIRVVRNGIGIHEIAELDMEGIEGIWALKASDASAGDSILALSFAEQTSFLAVGGDEMEATEVAGAIDNASSLYCGNVVGDNWIQVVESAVRLIACSSRELIAEWSFPDGKKISACSCNTVQLMVASGRDLRYLKVRADGLVDAGSTMLEHEVACLDASPPEGEVEATVCTVGLWTDISIRVLDLTSGGLIERCKELLGGEIIPRSVLQVTLEGQPYVLCALGDGTLFSYQYSDSAAPPQTAVGGASGAAAAVGGAADEPDAGAGAGTADVTMAVDGAAEASGTAAAAPVDPTTATPTHVLSTDTASLTAPNRASLGTQPITLSTFTHADTTHVFASSDRPTVIYSSNRKLIFSNVNLPEVTRMCALNAEAFPNCITLVSSSGLTIGAINEIQKLQIKTIPMAASPYRIAYQGESSTFVVLTMSEPEDDQGLGAADLTPHNAVRLLHHQTFEELDVHQLRPNEEPLSVVSTKFVGDDAEYYCVGTAIALVTEAEPTEGRVLVFRVVGGKLTVVATAAIKGAPYSMVPFNGKVAVAVTSSVLIFKWNMLEDGTKELEKECGNAGHVTIMQIKTQVRRALCICLHCVRVCVRVRSRRSVGLQTRYCCHRRHRRHRSSFSDSRSPAPYSPFPLLTFPLHPISFCFPDRDAINPGTPGRFHNCG
jgi:DNA damage-binding protein 1